MFDGIPSKDFSPITDSWKDFKLDTLQHKAILRVSSVQKIRIEYEHSFVGGENCMWENNLLEKNIGKPMYI